MLTAALMEPSRTTVSATPSAGSPEPSCAPPLLRRTRSARRTRRRASLALNSARALARADDSGVEAEQVQSAVETRVFDLEAAVHDDRQALRLAVDGCILIPD